MPGTARPRHGGTPKSSQDATSLNARYYAHLQCWWPFVPFPNSSCHALLPLPRPHFDSVPYDSLRSIPQGLVTSLFPLIFKLPFRESSCFKSSFPYYPSCSICFALSLSAVVLTFLACFISSKRNKHKLPRHLLPACSECHTLMRLPFFSVPLFVLFR